VSALNVVVQRDRVVVVTDGAMFDINAGLACWAARVAIHRAKVEGHEAKR